MPDRLADWLALVEALYPAADAAGWDRTGLQVGDPDDAVSAVLVCLDVTNGTLDEAVGSGAELVLAHHPLLFRPLDRLTPDTAAGQLALRAARQGLAVVAAHTNFDAAVGGTSDPAADLLGLTDVRALAPLEAAPSDEVKLVTFVPADRVGSVLGALATAGAGVIGEYDHCSFRVAGTGTFRPSADSQPTVGERERLNEVDEDRLEVVVPRERLSHVIAALLVAHPYEEVAYDVYPLLRGPAAGKGLGRVGDLPEPLPLREVADRLAAGLPAPGLRVAGTLDRPVRRVAVCGGAGESLVEAALASDADLYVTGDLRHHAALNALTLGLALIDAGHYPTEAAALPGLTESLEAAARRRGLGARLVASSTRTDPWAAYRPVAEEEA